MGSVTCNRCGFVSFATSDVCRQCGNPLAAANPGAQPWQAQAAPYPYPQGAGFGGRTSNGMAVLALVCGIVGLPALLFVVTVGMLLGGDLMACGLLGFAAFTVSSLLGIILGVTARVRATKLPLEFGGKGVAVAGIVLGALSLICVVPLGIISAIAIPNLLASRRAANEGAAIGSLRALVAAQNQYQATVGNGEYGTLEELADARIIDPQLSSGVRHGYRFEVEVNENSYVLKASPLEYSNTGTRSFYSSETGVIRAADKRGRAADEDDPALGDYQGERAIYPSSDGRESPGIGYSPSGR